MILIFATDPVPTHISKSIFLAGPSPRDKNTFDWKKTALEFFEKNNFDGHVFIPIPKNKFYGLDDSADWTYDNQIEWEVLFRKIADIILFWIPRDIQGKMPAFTTNIEFGEDLNTGKIVYGRPDNAEKCRYLDKRILNNHQPIYNDLSTLISACIKKLEQSSLRTDNQFLIPLFIWNNKDFQSWFSKFKNYKIKNVPFVHTQFFDGFQKITLNIDFEFNSQTQSELFQTII
jgi:hypothetical protein